MKNNKILFVLLFLFTINLSYSNDLDFYLFFAINIAVKKLTKS